MRKNQLLLITILMLMYSVNAVQYCEQIQTANSQQVWQIMKLSTFDRIFLLSAGSLSIILLILTVFSWKVYQSFSTPSDIMFAIVLSQLVENSALVVEAGYFTWSDNQMRKPQSFDNVCKALGIWNIVGNVSSIYYNLIFCVILCYSIQKTLKGFLFNRFRYHLISFILTGAIVLLLVLTESLGRGLNGVCGFKITSKQSTARFVLQIIISAICLYSMITFKRKLPKNQFFQKQSSFGFYYYYMGIFALTQIISSVSFLVSDIMCKVNMSGIAQNLRILFSISICSSIILSYFLVFMRFKHPLIMRKVLQLFGKKKTDKQLFRKNDQIQPEFTENQEENDQENSSWLGCLLESLKGSQILSFLEGITVAFVEKQRKFNSRQPPVLSFHKHYNFKVNQKIVQNYIERRISFRQSFMVQQKLGGLIGLDYTVTSYCPDVFSSLCTLQQLRAIIRSLDIRKNIKVISKQSHMNGGKSGELFFSTFDNRIIFKTIREDQLNAYLQKIRDFTDYFRKQKKTLIVKILGMFKFVRNDIREQPIFLMLMYNITMLPRELNIRVYDIKGSEFNRSTMQQNRRIRNKEEKLRKFTLKDKDFKLIETTIKINSSHARELKSIARKDIQFLGSLGFMDYSLIIVKREGEPSARKDSILQAKSTKEQGRIYNFGIIDYLQSWTLKRKAQRVLKTLITNEQVTAESPLNYSHRLCEFIDTII